MIISGTVFPIRFSFASTHTSIITHFVLFESVWYQNIFCLEGGRGMAYTALGFRLFLRLLRKAVDFEQRRTKKRVRKSSELLIEGVL